MTIISTVAVNQYLSISRKRKLNNYVEQCFCSLLNLRYSTLLVSLVFHCILTAFSHHTFITLKDRLVVIAVVRNFDNICVL